jgi:hypothetical protein
VLERSLAAVLLSSTLVSLAVSSLAACTKGAPDQGPERPAPGPSEPPGPSDPKPDPASSTHAPQNPAKMNPPAPPTPQQPPAQDTKRYVDWLAGEGKAIKDTAREDVALRVGDWGFYDHGGGPGQFLDRAGVHKGGKAIVNSDKGAWHAFLTTPGLDAAGALKRVAWLYAGGALVPPGLPPKLNHIDKVTPPQLTVAGKEATLQGWMLFPPNMTSPMRVTIKASEGATPTIAFEAAAKLP